MSYTMLWAAAFTIRVNVMSGRQDRLQRAKVVAPSDHYGNF